MKEIVATWRRGVKKMGLTQRRNDEKTTMTDESL